MAKFILFLLVSGYLLVNCFGGGAALQTSLNTDKGPTTRVTGGGSAVAGEFPFMLRVAEAAGCGAVLISPTCALTAAHCVRHFVHHTVIAGDWDADEWEDTEQVRDACVTHHPGYNSTTRENDIAFLRTGPFRTVNNTFVRPIELPGEGSLPSTSFNATVMGWGGPAAAGGRRHGDRVLKKAVVSTWSDQDCRDVYGNDTIRDSMLCAGSEADVVEIFAEDSGGPLVVSLDAERSMLVGLVSSSTREPTDPGVFTEIAYFMPWIQDLLNQNVSLCWRY